MYEYRYRVRLFLTRLKYACLIELPLTLIEYEQALRKAAKRTRLTTFKISPHSARHNGASNAPIRLILDLTGVQIGAGGSPRTPFSTMRKSWHTQTASCPTGPSSVNNAGQPLVDKGTS